MCSGTQWMQHIQSQWQKSKLKTWIMLWNQFLNVFLSFPGVLTHDIELFGNSWVETEPHEARCPMVPSGFSSPCDSVEAHVLLVWCFHATMTRLCIYFSSEKLNVFCACRKWKRCVQCCWILHFRAATTLSALCPTWPAAPTTSACENTRFLLRYHLICPMVA